MPWIAKRVTTISLSIIHPQHAFYQTYHFKISICTSLHDLILNENDDLQKGLTNDFRAAWSLVATQHNSSTHNIGGTHDIPALRSTHKHQQHEHDAYHFSLHIELSGWMDFFLVVHSSSKDQDFLNTESY